MRLDPDDYQGGVRSERDTPMRGYLLTVSAVLSLLTLASFPILASPTETSPRLLTGHTSDILSIAYSPNGHVLATPAPIRPFGSGIRKAAGTFRCFAGT